jgi:hypothetical protein
MQPKPRFTKKKLTGGKAVENVTLGREIYSGMDQL